MLQGFYWESYRHGHPQESFAGLREQSTGTRSCVRNAAVVRRGTLRSNFGSPPPSFAGEFSAGYNPKEILPAGQQLRIVRTSTGRCSRSCSGKGCVEARRRHRDQSSRRHERAGPISKNPDWGVWAICETDEAFQNAASRDRQYGRPPSAAVARKHPIRNTPATAALRTSTRASATSPIPTAGSARNHRAHICASSSPPATVGWAVTDMVHGYHAKWIAFIQPAHYTHVSPWVSTTGSPTTSKRGWILVHGHRC